jgi:hypothetical protein
MLQFNDTTNRSSPASRRDEQLGVLIGAGDVRVRRCTDAFSD